MEWVAFAVNEMRTQKNDGGVRGVELRRQQNDGGLDKIKTGCDRSPATSEKRIGDVTGNKRPGRGDKWNEKSNQLKLRGLEIDVVSLAHETRKPLIDSLPNGSGAGISAGHDPDDRV